MAEPMSSTAGAAVGTKFFVASGIGAALAAVVVMAMTAPKSKRETVSALICSLVTSVGGASLCIDYFALQAWTDVSKFLIAFGCGMPGWVAVRAFFAWTQKDPNKSLLDLLKDLRKAWKGEDA